MNLETYSNPYVVAAAEPDVRTKFIQRTYLHVALAILAFIGIEWALLQMDWSLQLATTMSANWGLVLFAFIAVSWVAEKWAQSGASIGTQYLGLAVFVVAEALIFLPMILIAVTHPQFEGSNILMEAGLFTGLLFVAITVVAFTTKKDFSFLGGMLKIAFFAAAGLIVVSLIFPSGVTLGTWFSVAMIVLAGGSILYNTSNIIHHYQPNQYVGAALSLFASIALLFWYILRLLMSRR